MWIFSKLPEGEPERDPRESEFFNVELDPAASLVREIIQNSLDARVPDGEKVHVKFNFGSYSPSGDSEYLHALVPHLKSSKLLPYGYEFDDTIPFLTIEDFNTCGLDGPINREEIKGDDKCNYYSFWWREGKSGKRGEDAGRWGLGKTVFYGASLFRSFWGFTVRQDDGLGLLLGKSLMKTHKHTDGEIYKYFAYFAENNFKPISDRKIIDNFRNKFGVTRNNEPGLSIVIPGALEISPEAIISSTIIHYFFPIMKNMLVVEVNSDSTHTILDSTTLIDLALKQKWEDTEWKDRSADSLMGFLRNVAAKPVEELISLELPQDNLRINESLFGENFEAIKKGFADNDLLWMRVPVSIQETGEASIESHFEIYLQKDDSLKQSDEFYIRSGITISNIKILGNRRVRGLLFAQDKKISTFLGDSESPAHTLWNERTEDFQKKYLHARDTLRFIRSSMRELVRILDQPSPGLNPDFLRDIFFVSDETKSGDGTVRPPTPPPPAPQIFAINKIKGGCNISLSDKKFPLPIQATIRFAYDVLRGSPFSNYHPLDFNLNSDTIKTFIEGGEIADMGDNRLLINIESHNLGLKVTGFDEHRDLVVDVRQVTS